MEETGVLGGASVTGLCRENEFSFYKFLNEYRLGKEF